MTKEQQQALAIAEQNFATVNDMLADVGRGVGIEDIEDGFIVENILAKFNTMKTALERIASDECYKAVRQAGDYAEAGRYTLPEMTAWFRGVAKAALEGNPDNPPTA